MSTDNSKLAPSESVPMLTNMFVNLCAINAFKIHLAQMDEVQKQGVIESMLKQWEKECRDIFDSRFLQINEQLKNVPVKDRLQAAMQVDRIKDQFEFDLTTSKLLVAGLL
jgi:hypothetical protein